MKAYCSSLLLLAVLASCSTTNYMTIDIREPAAVELAPQDRNVILVDNVANTPKNNTHEEEATFMSLDSARSMMLSNLSSSIGNQKYFDKISIYPINTGIEGYNDRDMPLDADLIQNICERTSSDLLISVDEFVVDAELVSDYTIDLQKYNSEEVRLGTVLRVYSKDGVSISQPIIYQDSLYWEDTASWGVVYNNIPPINEAVKQMVEKSSDDILNAIVPSWRTVDRWYYSDNSSQVKEGVKYAKLGKWDQAGNTWEKLFDKEKNNTRKIKLASNIALAYENMDDVETAFKWINTAYSMLNDKNSELGQQVASYKSMLKDREDVIPILNEQLGTISTK